MTGICITKTWDKTKRCESIKARCFYPSKFGVVLQLIGAIQNTMLLVMRLLALVVRNIWLTCLPVSPAFDKIGTYGGNGSNKFVRVECGFKPGFVIIKGNNNSDWILFDMIRGDTRPLLPGLDKPTLGTIRFRRLRERWHWI